MIATGALLGERYRLDARLATGGMGEVWRARDGLLDRDVAVKILKHEYADDRGFADRFRAEAKHTAGLAHPGIASVFDYGEADGTAYLVMELVPGEPLSAVLAREGRLPPERTLDLVTQAARALDAAHRGGVIHRDVKPGNILVTPGGAVKLTDFGIARAADAVPLTQTGVVMGTAHYLAPEQASGQPVTAASDVYSLGVVAYECLAGRRPFDAETPVGLAMAHLYDAPPPLPPDVPPVVADLVGQALAKEPADRFATAEAFARAAEATRSPATPTAVLPVVARRASRVPLLVAVLAALAVLVSAATVWSVTRPPPRRTVPPLVGLAERAATDRLHALGLDVRATQRDSTRYAAGAVMAQQPAAGVRVRKGDDVFVTISTGPKPVRLPSGLAGQDVDTVLSVVRGLGLVATVQGAFSDAPAGTVIDVSPATGLREGSTVVVMVSAGRGRHEHGKGKGGD